LRADLPYSVHIEAISATNLITNYNVAESVIDQPLWNAAVLQEASYQPIPFALSQNNQSDPMVFCSAVATIEQGIHSVAPATNVYLYMRRGHQPTPHMWTVEVRRFHPLLTPHR